MHEIIWTWVSYLDSILICWKKQGVWTKQPNLAKPKFYVTFTIQEEFGATLCNGITIHDNYGRLF